MSTFAVTDANQLLDAVNYALSNLGQNTGNGGSTGNSVTINTQTGVIGQGGIVYSYLYRYITVRYATAADGTGLTTNPIGATYFGVYDNGSQTPPDASNPGNYQWTQCTSALSSTNLLWYSTLGGRQIQFYVGTQASLPQPASNWAQVNNVTPSNVIDLDFVTATATLPLVVMTAFYNAANANIAPSTPTGGTYDFGNLIFTAPTGWSNSIPANNVAFFSSQNQFQAIASGNTTVGPVGPWTAPVLTGKLGTNGANGVSTYNYPVYQSANSTPATPTGGYYNFGTGVGTPPSGWANVATSGSGNTIYVSSTTVSSNVANANVAISSWSTPVAYSSSGTPGPRGSMPMAYVITTSNPIGASDSTLNTWFAASPTGTPAGSNSAPIGTGFFPQTGDTAAFTNTGNSAQVAVLTFSSNTSPNWTQVNGQVINGNLFITQSVNAGKLNANDVYTLNLTGGTGQVGNNSSGGFWMQASSGNARMAGSVSIGNLLTVGSNAVIGGNLSIGANANIANNLTIGNNAYIGGNLTVTGLITGNGAISTLNANTVTTTTVVPQSITATDYFQTSYNVMDIQYPVGNVLYYAGTTITANCTSAGNVITQAGYFPDWLSDQYFLHTSNVSVTSGPGAFASGTAVNQVLNDTQLTVSGSGPTTPLSNSTLRTVGVQYPYVRSFPGLYITTTAANQIAQLSLNGLVELDTVCTALVSPGIGTVELQVYVYRYPYVFDSSIDTNTGTYIYSQYYTFPNVYFTSANQVLTQPFSFSNIVASCPTAGEYVFTIACAVVPLNGTFTFNRLAISALAGSGTVLKNQ
jgi:hypothetical protein